MFFPHSNPIRCSLLTHMQKKILLMPPTSPPPSFVSLPRSLAPSPPPTSPTGDPGSRQWFMNVKLQLVHTVRTVRETPRQTVRRWIMDKPHQLAEWGRLRLTNPARPLHLTTYKTHTHTHTQMQHTDAYRGCSTLPLLYPYQQTREKRVHVPVFACPRVKRLHWEQDGITMPCYILLSFFSVSLFHSLSLSMAAYCCEVKAVWNNRHRNLHVTQRVPG